MQSGSYIITKAKIFSAQLFSKSGYYSNAYLYFRPSWLKAYLRSVLHFVAKVGEMDEG